MDLTNKKKFFDKVNLRTYYGDSMKTLRYEDNEIPSDIINIIKISIENKWLQFVELSNKKEHLVFTAYHEDGVSFFGIIDMYNDIDYYYDNGEERNDECVDIAGQSFDQWMVCYDNNILYDSIEYFALNGGRNPKIHWIEQ